MEVKNQVRKRNVKQNEDLSENGESNVTDKFENQEFGGSDDVRVGKPKLK